MWWRDAGVVVFCCAAGIAFCAMGNWVWRNPRRYVEASPVWSVFGAPRDADLDPLAEKYVTIARLHAGGFALFGCLFFAGATPAIARLLGIV